MSHHLEGKEFATRQIHAGKIDLPGISPLATPIFQTSTFVFDSTAQGAARFAGEEQGYIYTRLGNPNQLQLAQKLASLEGGEAALALASGMGAISTTMWTSLQAGDHILADDTLYGCTFALFTHGLPRYGITHTLTDFSNIENVKAGLTKKTRVVYFETPANPNMKVIDIEAVASAVHAYDPTIRVVVDNTFASPYLQRPLELGVDVVVHSGTKYLNGHGDVICGFIVGKQEFITECSMFGLKDMTGAVMSPHDAFLVNRGLKTLDLRMERHAKNAAVIAEFLDGHPKVRKVYYPGLKSHPGYDVAKKQMRLPGGMLSFDLNADKATSERFINSLELCTLAVSLGDAETLIEHPASMTHSTYSPQELASAGINESLIRLSVGLEGVQDILDDLKDGLARI